MAAKRPPDGYLTVPEAAKLCGVTRQTMYNWVLTQGRVPYVSRTAGAMTFYCIKREDAEELERTHGKKRKMIYSRYHFYEIVFISLGELTVLYQTESLKDLSRTYTHMIEKDHKLIRVRADGKLLTIHESDALGNAFHPRCKRSAI